MQISIASIGTMFPIVELLEWMKTVSLTIPAYLLGGLLLAIASNYDRLVNTTSNSATASQETIPPPTEAIETPAPRRSISFTINPAVHIKQQKAKPS